MGRLKEKRNVIIGSWSKKPHGVNYEDTYKHKGWYADGRGGARINPTHWMPLPVGPDMADTKTLKDHVHDILIP